jgi:hypothetical protein
MLWDLPQSRLTALLELSLGSPHQSPRRAAVGVIEGTCINRRADWYCIFSAPNLLHKHHALSSSVCAVMIVASLLWFRPFSIVWLFLNFLSAFCRCSSDFEHPWFKFCVLHCSILLMFASTTESVRMRADRELLFLPSSGLICALCKIISERKQ